MSIPIKASTIDNKTETLSIEQDKIGTATIYFLSK